MRGGDIPEVLKTVPLTDSTVNGLNEEINAVKSYFGKNTEQYCCTLY